MSHVELELPESVHQEVLRLAKETGIAADELMVRTLSKAVKAELAFRELEARAKRGSIAQFRRILAKAPHAPAMPGDELPAGFRLPGKARGKRRGSAK